MYKLITSIKQQNQRINTLIENCALIPGGNTAMLFESADKVLGNAIAALKSGKNPFENKNFRDVVAGLMLLSKETNRDAVNMNKKRFDIVSQLTSQKENVQKYVADLAREHGQSLIKDLDAYVANKDRRDVLVRKLLQHQNIWNQAKHKGKREDELQQKHKGNREDELQQKATM